MAVSLRASFARLSHEAANALLAGTQTASATAYTIDIVFMWAFLARKQNERTLGRQPTIPDYKSAGGQWHNELGCSSVRRRTCADLETGIPHRGDQAGSIGARDSGA